MPTPPCPGGRDLEPVGRQIKGHLQLQRGTGIGVLAFGLLGRLRRSRRSRLVDSRDLVRNQFFDLIDRSHGERCTVLFFGQGGAPLKLRAVNLDHRPDGLRLGPRDGFGVLWLEFDLSDQSFGIKSTTFDEVGLLEGGLPLFRKRHKPPLQGFRGVGAIGRTWGRHRRTRIKPAPISSYNPQTLPILSRGRSGFDWVLACDARAQASRI